MQSETNNVGMAQPSAEDLRHGANRVELYICPNCNEQTRFPRYKYAGLASRAYGVVLVCVFCF